MKAKRTTGLFCMAAGLMLLFSLLCTIPVLGADVAPDSGSPPTEDPGDVLSGDLSITGYTVYTNPSGATPVRITAGMGIQLKLEVFDTRPSASVAPDKLLPRARLNTSSFTAYNGMEPAIRGMKYITRGSESGWSYTMDFPLVYQGVGNTFQCDIFYQSQPNIPLVEKTLQLNNCVEKEEDSSSSGSDDSTVVRGTGFVLKSVEYGGPNVTAGQQFTLNVEMMATNGSYGVDNVTVAITPPVEMTLATGSSNYFVGSVAPNETVPISYALQASAAISEAGSYKVTLEITGANAKDGAEVTSSVDVTIPVVPLERFEISNVTLPEMISAGMDDGSGYGTVRLVNKGKGTIYNVSAQIIGDGLTTEEGNQFVGNVAAGTESDVDFNIKSDTPGQINAQLLVTYENDQGEEKTLSHDFSITVQDGMGMGVGDGGMDPFPVEPIEPEPSGIPLWVWLVGGAVVVAGVVVVIVVVKKKKARKAAELEDEEDEDF